MTLLIRVKLDYTSVKCMSTVTPLSDLAMALARLRQLNCQNITSYYQNRQHKVVTISKYAISQSQKVEKQVKHFENVLKFA